MTYKEWKIERQAVDAEIAEGYRDQSDDKLAKATEHEEALRARVQRYFSAGPGPDGSVRGYVSIGFGARTPGCSLTVRDRSRFMESTYYVDSIEGCASQLSVSEIASLQLAGANLDKWVTGELDELPPGISRDEATAPWSRA